MLTFSVVFSMVLQGYNILNYPYYENDEGTYFSQAYAVAYEGKLSNYTYWYDHAPLGWIFTASWMLLTGGPFTFGFSLYSARIFMLVLHFLSSLFIYAITKKVTKNDLVAAIAVIFFSASPLGIYFQRRLLLDNIMVFWLLLTTTLIFYSKQRLSWILFSGITFCIAILSKETAVITLPGFTFLALNSLHKKQRIIGLAAFISPLVLGVSYFVLYALLKNELLPGPDHVSLVSAFLYQITRGSGLLFWKSNSDFMVNFIDWLNKDRPFLLALLVSSLWITFGYKKSTQTRIIGAIILLFWLFLIRGGLVINFYILPVVAFGSITIALSLLDISKLKYIGKILVLILISGWLITLDTKQWRIDETSPQVQSINWIKGNINPNAVIAVDQSQLIDIQKSRFAGDPSFNNAHFFWKLEQDPKIKNIVANEDWQNIDYLILTHEFLKQVKLNNLKFIAPTIDHVNEVASWGPLSPETYLDVDQKISTNGDWVKVYKLLDRTDIVLKDSWEFYKKTFINYEGRVIDPKTNLTTSEGQSYALLRSVIMNDKKTFEVVWNWTSFHLQYRNEDRLFSWKYGIKEDNTIGIIDSESATDADIDIATALLLASKKWNIPVYGKEAEIIIQNIWDKEVIKLKDENYYLLAGTWAGYGGTIVVNPSYISPASFRLFQTVDSAHDWLQLRRNSYALLVKLIKQNKSGLIPDWIVINKTNQETSLPTDSKLSLNFGYDAVRVYWRIAQDYLWFINPDALDFLNKQDFLVNYWKEQKRILPVFSLNGIPTVDYEDNASYGALLPYFKITDETTYQDLKKRLQSEYNNGAWKNNDNYYTQNWAWLGLALSEGKFEYDK